MKKLLITSKKGGVGKTTTVINLGDLLELRGNKVIYATSDSNQTLTLKKSAIVLKERSDLKQLEKLDADYLLIDTSADFARAINTTLLDYCDFMLYVTGYDEFSNQSFFDFYDGDLYNENLRNKLMGILPNLTKHRNVFKPQIKDLEEFSIEENVNLFSKIPEYTEIQQAIKTNTPWYEYIDEKSNSYKYLQTSYNDILNEALIHG